MNKEQLKNAVIVLATFSAQEQDFVTMEELEERNFPWDCIGILTVDTYEDDDFDEETDEPLLGFDVHDSLINGLYQLGYVLQ